RLHPPRCRAQPRLSHFPYTTLFRSQNDVEQNELLLPYDQNAFIVPYLPRAECSKIAAKFCGKNPVSPVDICRLLRYNKHRSGQRSEEHTSELQSRFDLVCRLLLEKQ